MCTFCGRNHNSRPRTKTVRIYGKKDKYLGMKEVHIDTSERDVRQSLYREYPDWDYFTGFEK
jgi:hypothetical protein